MKHVHFALIMWLTSILSAAVAASPATEENPAFFVEGYPGQLSVAPGEEVQWELLERGELHHTRPNTPAPSTKARARK